MNSKVELQKLVEHFEANIEFYKDTKKAYNEHSCRIEFIDPFLKILGWDVANEKGAAPQYREVIAENYSSRSDRPDYTMTLRGVAKFFVEAKKPSVDITKVDAPAIQTRKYGWNAKHRLAVLTNFEFLAIYDTCHFPLENDSCTVARYRLYHYSEYVEKLDEICGLISRSTVYSGAFDQYLDANFPASGGQTQQVDELFLSQINNWRIALSNELYAKGGRYTSLEVLNDVVQEFINQIVFLRICEDRNLPLYHNLKEAITDRAQLQESLEQLFRAADQRYNSGMFSGDDIIFDLSCDVITDMIGSPKICVQVKSTDAPVDRIVLDQLGGVMKNFGAEYGLLVSWSGFKSSVINETAKQFFEIRLWTHKEIIEEFLRYYDQMDDEIKELIPLKKIWVVNNNEE